MRISVRLATAALSAYLLAGTTAGCQAPSPDESEDVEEAEQELSSDCWGAYQSSWDAVSQAYLAYNYASGDGTPPATVQQLSDALDKTIATRTAAFDAVNDPSKAGTAKTKAQQAAKAFENAAPGIVGFWAQYYTWGAHTSLGDVQWKEDLCTQ